MSTRTLQHNHVSTTRPRRRSAAVDAVRVLGIVAIVVGHTWPSSVDARAFIGLWRVAAFLFLTGYLWSGSRPFVEDAAHRARALMRPYVFWLLVIGIPLVTFKVEEGHSAINVVGGLLRGQQIGRPFSAFWFVALLFLSGVVVRAGQAVPRALLWGLAVAGVLAATVWGPEMARTPYSTGMVPVAVFFVLAGQELARRRAQIRRPALLGGALLVVWLVAVHCGVQPLDLKHGVLGTPAVSVLTSLVVSVGSILVAEAGTNRLSHGAQTIITKLASVGIVVLLLHSAVLYVTDNIAGLPLPACFAAALVVPWLVGFGLARTRLSPWAIGRNRREALLRARDEARLPRSAEQRVVSNHAVTPSRPLRRRHRQGLIAECPHPPSASRRSAERLVEDPGDERHVRTDRPQMISILAPVIHSSWGPASSCQPRSPASDCPPSAAHPQNMGSEGPRQPVLGPSTRQRAYGGRVPSARTSRPGQSCPWNRRSPHGSRARRR